MNEKGKEIEFFLHQEGVPVKVASGTHDEALMSLLARYGVRADEEMFIFVGECDSCLDEDDSQDGQDTHETVSIHATLLEIDVQRLRHVHCHRCHRIGVDVNYQGDTRRHRFSPATTIARATEWARKKFKLHDADAQKLMLFIPGSPDPPPRPDVHLGSLAHAPHCKLVFDLAPDKKIEGSR